MSLYGNNMNTNNMPNVWGTNIITYLRVVGESLIEGPVKVIGDMILEGVFTGEDAIFSGSVVFANIPSAAGTPVDADDLTTKDYVDTAISGETANLLESNNTWTGTNTYDKKVVNNLDVDFKDKIRVGEANFGEGLDKHPLLIDPLKLLGIVTGWDCEMNWETWNCNVTEFSMEAINGLFEFDGLEIILGPEITITSAGTLVTMFLNGAVTLTASAAVTIAGAGAIVLGGAATASATLTSIGLTLVAGSVTNVTSVTTMGISAGTGVSISSTANNTTVAAAAGDVNLTSFDDVNITATSGEIISQSSAKHTIRSNANEVYINAPAATVGKITNSCAGKFSATASNGDVALKSTFNDVTLDGVKITNSCSSDFKATSSGGNVTLTATANDVILKAQNQTTGNVQIDTKKIQFDNSLGAPLSDIELSFSKDCVIRSSTGTIQFFV